MNNLNQQKKLTIWSGILIKPEYILLKLLYYRY